MKRMPQKTVPRGIDALLRIGSAPLQPVSNDGSLLRRSSALFVQTQVSLHFTVCRVTTRTVILHQQLPTVSGQLVDFRGRQVAEHFIRAGADDFDSTTAVGDAL